MCFPRTLAAFATSEAVTAESISAVISPLIALNKLAVSSATSVVGEAPECANESVFIGGSGEAIVGRTIEN